MFKKLLPLMLVSILILSACGSAQSAQEGGLTKIRLPMGYIPNIQYAPFYAAIEKGYFEEAGFEIEFDYSFETDGVKLVGVGELPFAVVSGEQVLLARAQDVPVTYVAAWYQQFPISVVSTAEANISTVEDLKGRTIGLPGLFGATYIGLRALLFSAGLGEADVTLEEIGFNQVELTATGKQDIVVGYAANEPIQLRAQGVEVNELRVADSVQLAANGILTSEKLIREDPEMVRRFVTAFIKGLEFTIYNPQEAFDLSAKYIPNFTEQDQKVQREILNTSLTMWIGSRFGYSDPAAWENMKQILVEMGLVPADLDLTRAYSNDFIP